MVLYLSHDCANYSVRALVARFAENLNAQDDIIYEAAEINDAEQNQVPDHGSEGARGYRHIDERDGCKKRKEMREERSARVLRHISILG